MKELEKLLQDIREKNLKGQAFGSILGKINKDRNLTEQLKEKTKFLDRVYTNISASQRFYHIWFKIELEICPYCSDHKKFTFNNKFSINQYEKRDANYCGTCSKDECNKKYNKERGIKKLEEKHGTKNIWEIPGYRENLENSNLKKYGEKYYTSTKDFKDKFKENIDKNWDGNHPTKFKSVQEKKKVTCLEKYGVDCLLKDKELMKSSMMKKYGVEYNMQIDAVHEKAMESMRRYYDYVFPSGKTIKIQEYEKFAINYLLKYFSESDIIVGASQIKKFTGSIIYENNKRYYPDIYIKSVNKIFEVKSSYTYELHKEINEQKKSRCLELDIDFEFLIFDKKGNFV